MMYIIRIRHAYDTCVRALLILHGAYILLDFSGDAFTGQLAAGVRDHILTGNGSKFFYIETAT
jgi:hypothetical protein